MRKANKESLNFVFVWSFIWPIVGASIQSCFSFSVNLSLIESDKWKKQTMKYPLKSYRESTTHQLNSLFTFLTYYFQLVQENGHKAEKLPVRPVYNERHIPYLHVESCSITFDTYRLILEVAIWNVTDTRTDNITAVLTHYNYK